MNMNKFKYFFAALLFGAFALSSCNKEPAVPATRTVLARIVNSNDNLLDTFQYDENYRLIHVTSMNPFTNKYLNDITFTYSDDTIVAEGYEAGYYSTKYVCTLDSEGRIEKVERLFHHDGSMQVEHYFYTYDENGHLVSSRNSYLEESPDATTTYTWVGDEIKKIVLADGLLIIDFETSKAPAEAFFTHFEFREILSYLCPQGCLGRVPAHLPSKITTNAYLNGTPIYSKYTDLKATIDENGHLATLETFLNGSTEGSKYVLIWQEQ